MPNKCQRKGCEEEAENGLPWCLIHLAEMGEIIENYPLVSDEFYKRAQGQIDIDE